MKKTLKIAVFFILISGFFVSVVSAIDIAEGINKTYRELIKKQIYTEKQADSLWWKLNERDMILTPIKEETLLGDRYYDSLLRSDESLNVTRLLVDYPTATASYLYGQSPLQNIREVWLSPQVDSWEYINDLQKVFADLGAALYFDGSGGMFNGFCKKGDSAAREWCPGHEYTGKAYTASRMKQHMTCQQPNEWYYSCKWCGKCEYNPKHTFSDGVPKSPAHDFARFDISDKNYIGTNKQGEEVYCLSCRWCGINTRDDDLGLTYKFFLYSTGNKDVPGMKEAYNMYMEQKKNSWKKGGQNYEYSLNVTTKDNINTFSFAVPKFKKVVAKISENAQDGVYWAARNGLVDESVLGDDFTKPLTRLQASAIAVAIAEKLSGKSVSSAKSKTYSDTKSRYALKAAKE